MTQPWNPHRRLSDEEYRRLSLSERRALFEARKQRQIGQRYERALDAHARRYAPTPARYRQGYFARRRRFAQLVALAVMAGVTMIGWIGDRLPSPVPALGVTQGEGVRASFGACKWGGARNCVVDGDTIHLDGMKIRIAGIDAPETHDYGCASELALGERAAERLQGLLNSGAVTLSGIGRDEDVYGRKLRNVAVDGRDVGDTLIGEGLTRAYAGGRRPWC